MGPRRVYSKYLPRGKQLFTHRPSQWPLALGGVYVIALKGSIIRVLKQKPLELTPPF